MYKKNFLSISKQYHLIYFGLGCVWLATSLLGFFENPVVDTLRYLCFVLSLFIMLFYVCSKKEKSDEMAEQNINKAKAIAFDITWIIICFLTICVLICSELFSDSFDLTNYLINGLFLLMGIKDILISTIFRKLEE